MLVALVYEQLRIGWDDLDYYPEFVTWRGLLVVVSIGYVPAVAMTGLSFIFNITKLLY